MKISVLVLALVACTGDSAPDAAACGGPPASSELPAQAADAGGLAHVRVFNFIGPSMQGSAIDVCVQATGDTAWTGPVYRNTHTYPKYSNVAPYVDLPPELYRVRVVPWGTAECEATLAGLADDVELTVPFRADAYQTLVLSAWVLAGKQGVPEQPLVAQVLDDKSGFGPKELSVRILNMDPGVPSIDVWKAPKNADPATWQLIVEGVPFGQVARPTEASPYGAADAAGYMHQTPGDWPVSIVQNLALCPHATKENCWVVGSQNVQGNITYFTPRAGAWKYDWVSDGARVYDENQPHMTRSDEWW